MGGRGAGVRKGVAHLYWPVAMAAGVESRARGRVRERVEGWVAATAEETLVHGW